MSDVAKKIRNAALIAVVLVDAFEAMILPRRVAHAYLARLFYQSGWVLWRAVARLLPDLAAQRCSPAVPA